MPRVSREQFSLEPFQELVEFDLSFVRENKRTFFDASQEAMDVAMSVGNGLKGIARRRFAKVIECIAIHESLLESV